MENRSDKYPIGCNVLRSNITKINNKRGAQLSLIQKVLPRKH